MKKFLLVFMIGMVLTMDIFGVVKEIVDYFEVKEEVVDGNYEIVYVE